MILFQFPDVKRNVSVMFYVMLIQFSYFISFWFWTSKELVYFHTCSLELENYVGANMEFKLLSSSRISFELLKSCFITYLAQQLLHICRFCESQES